jgi:hypothetical protein
MFDEEVAMSTTFCDDERDDQPRPIGETKSVGEIILITLREPGECVP